MKVSNTVLSLAVLSLAMVTPSFGQAPDQTAQDDQSSGLTVAEHMVPGRALLSRTLDAKSIHAGDEFRATLSDKVHLQDGAVLRRGDVLVGKIVADDNTPGNSRLSVRFTEVDRKNGQNIPIKATIVALYNPSQFLIDPAAQPEEVPNSWTDNTLSVEQLGVVNGVDLHSQIASEDSGVFVTSTKKDVKIPAGSEFALAISAQGNVATASGE